MILPTDSRLAKKLEKNQKNHRNIRNSRYFGEISKLYLTCACAGIFGKVSVNIGDISVNTIDISVKYQRYTGVISEISEIYQLF